MLTSSIKYNVVPKYRQLLPTLDYADSIGFTFVFMSMEEGLPHWEKLSGIELLSLPTYVDLRGRLSNE